MLELRAVSKQFGEFIALDGVNFSVRGGEIVALLGENGAGKSTLLGIVGGDSQPTSGEIRWRDASLKLRSPREASALGIGVVHQHFRLVPSFSVAENLALHSGESHLFHAREWRERVEKWAASLGWKMDARARVSQLSVGQRQRVEILKALFAGGMEAQLLLLDEPTANLTPRESDELFEVLRRLRDNGCGIVFVSHKLNEVMDLCERVVVLRRGKVVGEKAASETNARELAALMVGKELESTPEKTRTFGVPRLRIENLTFRKLHDFSLTVRAGEIVGLAGVDGNGQAELLEVLNSLASPERGEISIFNDNGAVSEGENISIIPPDRQREGLIGNFNITENFALHPAFRAHYRKGLRFDWRGARTHARTLMSEFDVRAPQAQELALASELSGGNQQKIVIARALGFAPRVVVAADPTRGLDVGATQFVHQQLRAAAERGAAILLVSTDLDEVISLSDRLGVFYDGKVLPNSQLLQPSASRETIGALMGGERTAEVKIEG